MTKRIEKTFVVAVPRERAWQAFVESGERSKWEADPYEIDPRPGGAVRWRLPGIEAVGVVDSVDAPNLLVHREVSGPHAGCEITVRFESVDDGTLVTITHAGFGDGEGWDEWLEGTTLGWDQAIADLIAYLETGVATRRFVTAMRNPGMTMTQTPAGVRVDTVTPRTLADEAGVQPGDLVVRVGAAPVFSIAELWVLMREHDVGTRLDIDCIRAGALHTGTGVLTDTSFEPDGVDA